MLFWIFVVLVILAIAVIVASKMCYHSGTDKNKFYKFVYRNGSLIYGISGTIAVVGSAVALIMLIFIIQAQVQADGYKASNEQRYNALIYKAQTESIRDKFGIVNKEYIDEVQIWNEELAKYQAYSDDFWIGIFYPKRVFDGFETINLEDIRMKE